MGKGKHESRPHHGNGRIDPIGTVSARRSDSSPRKELVEDRQMKLTRITGGLLAVLLASAALTGCSSTTDPDQVGLYYMQGRQDGRSEEHTSELQSLMRISYAVFCLTKQNT